jgi:hypothetical protein
VKTHLINEQKAEIAGTSLEPIVGRQKPIKAELFHLARSFAK